MDTQKKKYGMLMVDLCLFAILLAADQITKVLAKGKLMGDADVELIPGVLEFHYLENRGAAFSMMQNAQVVFMLAAALMCVAIVYILRRVPVGKRYLAWHITLAMIGAGGIGNLIDRLRFAYVVDFIYFSLIDFPVFNVADICVTLGVIALIIFVLFVWNEEDMRFL